MNDESKPFCSSIDAVLDAVPQGAALVSGGSGFLGSQIVRLLCEAGRTVHFFDINPPREDLPLPDAIFHQVSLTDDKEIDRLYGEVKPEVVFHVAAVIDCRPRPSSTMEDVNVGGTQLMLDCCRRHSVNFFVYTSTQEALFHNGFSRNASESTPYTTRFTQDYQRTKIAAEKMVLDANCSDLSTCSIRTGHMYGPGDDLYSLAYVPVCFGESILPCGPPAPISVLHVENAAAAHLLVSGLLLKNRQAGNKDENKLSGDDDVISGHAFNVADYENNIIHLYHEFAGVRPPLMTLPYWQLWLTVKPAVILSIIFHYLFCGLQITSPKNGLHEAALSAGLECTMDCTAARRILGYSSYISREAGIEQCRKWWNDAKKARRSKDSPPLIQSILARKI